jgi:tRNA wybutosine-synthesizing protein 4
VAEDLRKTDSLRSKFEALGVSTTAPTLILTEVVLVYLKPEDTNKILSLVKEYFTGNNVAMLNYEMINPSDPFGKVMLEHLEVSGDYLS